MSRWAHELNDMIKRKNNITTTYWIARIKSLEPFTIELSDVEIDQDIFGDPKTEFKIDELVVVLQIDTSFYIIGKAVLL